MADHSMSRCRFSPDGKLLAVAGRRGYVHLVDWAAGGAQVVGSLKGNATVKDMWWSRTHEGELMTLGEDSQIYTWDVRARRCVKRWKDDGGYGALIMGGDPLDGYISVGSVGLLPPPILENNGVFQVQIWNCQRLRLYGSLFTIIRSTRPSETAKSPWQSHNCDLFARI